MEIATLGDTLVFSLSSFSETIITCDILFTRWYLSIYRFQSTPLSKKIFRKITFSIAKNYTLHGIIKKYQHSRIFKNIITQIRVSIHSGNLTLFTFKLRIQKEYVDTLYIQHYFSIYRYNYNQFINIHFINRLKLLWNTQYNVRTRYIYFYSLTIWNTFHFRIPQYLYDSSSTLPEILPFSENILCYYLPRLWTFTRPVVYSYFNFKSYSYFIPVSYFRNILSFIPEDLPRGHSKGIHFIPLRFIPLFSIMTRLNYFRVLWICFTNVRIYTLSYWSMWSIKRIYEKSTCVLKRVYSFKVTIRLL